MYTFQIINEFKNWENVVVARKTPYFVLYRDGVIRGRDVNHITFRLHAQLPQNLYDFYMDGGLHILNMVSSVGVNGRNGDGTIINYKDYSWQTDVFNDYSPEGKNADEIENDINNILSSRMIFIEGFYDIYNHNKNKQRKSDKDEKEQKTEEGTIYKTGTPKIDATVTTILHLLDSITVPKSLSEEVYVINTARRDLSRLLSLYRENEVDKKEDKIEETFKLLNKMLSKIEKFSEFIKDTMSLEFNTELSFLNIKYDRI